MERIVASLTVVCCLAASAFAESKGACPPMGRVDAKDAAFHQKTTNPPRPDLQPAGATMLALVVSDKGYVCDARVLKPFDKGPDERALTSVKQWRFTPARHNGQAVPVTVVVEVQFWRDPQKPDDPLVMDSPQQQKQAGSPASNTETQ